MIPCIMEEHLRIGIVEKVRTMIFNKNPRHEWLKMSNKDFMVSAGLYEADFVTDALCRKENLDRYDDRLIVKTNLISSYELLMDFIAKHTLDKFCL